MTAVSGNALARQRAQHDYANVYLKLVERLDDLLAPRPRASWRVLDIGCGYHAPLVALFNGTVKAVSGVDVERVFLRDGRVAVFRERRHGSGILRAAKWATIRYSGYRAYYAELSRLAQRRLDLDAADLSPYDGQHLPFDDDTFDAVVSNAVLEHVADLEPFVDECARVLRPGGVLDMLWHSFHSPSGSHMGEPQATSDPWGHLVGRSARADLNRKRPEEFRAALETRFDVSRIVGADKAHRLEGEAAYTREGTDLLDATWRQQLTDYPDELLTTRSYLVQATVRRKDDSET